MSSDTMCISGMMPLSLLQVGTPQKIKDYAKKLIDVVGKGEVLLWAPEVRWMSVSLTL